MSIPPKRNVQLLRRAAVLVLRALLFVALVLVLLAFAFYMLVLVQPQGVSNFARLGLMRAQPHLSPYALDVGQVDVHVEHFGAPITVEGKSIRFLRGAALLAKAPSLRCEFGVSLFPTPRLRMRNLVLRAPVLYGQAGWGQEDAGPPTTNAERRAAWQNIKRRIRHLHRILAFRQMHVEAGRILLPREGEPLSGNWEMDLSYDRGKLSGRLQADLPHEEESADVLLTIEGEPFKSNARIEGQLNNLRTSWLQGLGLPDWLAGADYPLDATIKGEWKRDALASLEANLQASKGTLTWPAMFPDPLPVQSLKAHLVAGAGGHEVTIDDIAFVLPETTISARISAKEGPTGYGLTIASEFPELPTEKLGSYWPLPLAPNTRFWAVNNIRRGRIHEAALSLRLRPEDMDAPTLPKQSLRASMAGEGVEVQYLPSHQPARNVSGLLTFSGQDMRLDFKGADYLTATHVESGWLSIPSFDAPETALDAEFNVRTVAADVATLFATEEIDLAKRLHLTSEARGSATGQVGIHAIIFSSMPNPTPEYYASQFQYRVKTVLKDVGQAKFLGETDIADANMELSADNKSMSAEGTLKLNGVPAKLSLSGDFVADKTVTKVAMNLPAGKLPAFGYPVQQGVGGTIGVDATMNDGPEGNVTKADLDLTATSLDLGMVGFAKPVGEKATLAMTTRAQKDGSTIIGPLIYEGRNAALNGSLTLDAKGGIQGANLASVKFGKQNASIRYNRGKDGVPELFVRGSVLDLAALRAEQAKHSSKKPGNPLDPGPIRADVALDKLWLAPATGMEQVRGTLSCSASFCEAADIRGRVAANAGTQTAPSPFAIRIYPEGDVRRFRLSADNGGRFLSALDVTDHISGGKLVVEGSYDDTKSSHPLIGRVKMSEFYVREAPLLTKILSLTSPMGIVNAITGKGIEFNGLRSQFEFEQGTIRLKEARASGSALGLTADEASLQLGSTQMELKGTVIPAYMINSVIGKIPLIGEALLGGKDQGLIATRFGVSGTYEDPDVSVNPLSILTPGFLRGVFDVFDKTEDSEKMSGQPESEKPAKEREKR